MAATTATTATTASTATAAAPAPGPDSAAPAAGRPSYASGPSDAPLLGDTIGANLAATAARFADTEALVDVPSRRRFTYRQLDEAVDAVATGLLEVGIAKGDRIGIWAPNCPEWVLVQYAAARVGAILVTVNPAYRTSELQYALAQSGIRLLVAAPEFRGSDYGAMIAEVRPQCPDLETVILIGDDAWQRLEHTMPDRPRLQARAADLDPDDPINIQYTSGTTGFPKGATLSHHNILNNGYFIGHLLGYGGGGDADHHDRVCVPVPFYHCFGMVIGNLACTSTGATIVIPAPGFDPAATLRAVEQERCTSLYGVPTMFIAELACPTFHHHDLTSLRTGVMAGSPCPVEVMKRVVDEMHMGEVTIMYGMTETSPVSTMTRRDDDLERRVSTVGTVFPHVEVKVVDPATGHVVPRGHIGELCTRGYSVMLGYWDDDARTAEVLDRAGWMHTGDLATMDSAGYVNIVGRSKDMVIRGGENVYPREVEEFLYTHPDIVDVQVIGVPDARYGEELMAWVRLREGATLQTDELREWCRGKIAHFKIPRYVKVVDEFPMTVTGKVQKYKMRQAAIGELGLEEVAGTATA